MAIGVLALFVVMGLGILLLGGIVAVVRRRWRPLGFAFFGIAAVLGVGLMLVLVSVRSRPLARHPRPTRLIPLQEQIPIPPRPPKPPRIRIDTGPRGRMRVEVESPPEPSPEPAKKSGNILLAMGNAVAKVARDQKLKPKPMTAEKEPSLVEKADAKAANDAKTNELVRKLTAAVLDELPEDVDEYTALRTLGRYLARTIAEEREKGGAGQVAVMPVAAERSDESAKRPSWVDAAPGKVGDAYQFVAEVGPYKTLLECDQALPAELQGAVAEYADLYLGPAARGRVTFSDDYVQRHVVKEQWEERFTSPTVGPVVTLHTLLQFDSKVNRELEQKWRDLQIEDRLWLTGGGLGALLVVLGGVFVVMKADIATRGAYRGRFALVLLVALAILGLLALYSMYVTRPIHVEQRTGMQVVGVTEPDNRC